MTLTYQQERDEDFLKACEIVRSNTQGYISMTDIAIRAVTSPAQSYYLCPRQIAKICKCNISKVRSPVKRELYRKIKHLYFELKTVYPEISRRQIYKRLLEEPAERFYISDTRAVSLYYKLIKSR